MTKCASTFTTGLNLPVLKALNASLKNTKILKNLDGFLVFSTNSKTDTIKNLRFINNSFEVIEELENLSLVQIVKYLINNPPKIANQSMYGMEFRIMLSDANETRSINKNLLKKLENTICNTTGLQVNRGNPEIEFWIYKRREGYAFFGKRITKQSSESKYLKKGQLRHELANIMIRIANTNHKDIVMDPFAGYGSISLEAVRHFKYKKIISLDNDSNLVIDLKEKCRNIQNIQIEQYDSLEMNKYSNQIDKIITDPPWGSFKEIKNIKVFYNKMFTQFHKLLNKDGMAVLLSSQKELVKNITHSLKLFSIEEEYNILVNGKKASIYNMTKISK